MATIISAVKRAKAGAKAKSGPVRTGPPTPPRQHPHGGSRRAPGRVVKQRK